MRSVRKKKSARRSKVTQPQWPQPRQFMERPNRYQYVRKLIKTDRCVFCIAAEAEISAESLVLARSSHALVVMNKFPYNTGHLLIMPQRHCGEIWQLTDEETEEIARWLRYSAKALNDAYQCTGLNIGLNHGAVAGAGIPEHLHWHIVPRWFGDTNFFPLIAETKVLPETLEQSFAKLLPYFQGAQP